jgi:hypothetical protein
MHSPRWLSCTVTSAKRAIFRGNDGIAGGMGEAWEQLAKSLPHTHVGAQKRPLPGEGAVYVQLDLDGCRDLTVPATIRNRAGEAEGSTGRQLALRPLRKIGAATARNAAGAIGREGCRT